MAILRPNQLPAATTPLSATDLVVVDQGAGGVNAADPQDVVDAVAPVVSQPDAEAGTNNNDRMTALRTKQSIASEVGVTLASKTQGDLANSAVQPSRQVIAGNGLTGGGALSADVTLNVGAGTGISVTADAVGLDATTQSRLLIGGGTTSQVLQKSSNADYDVEWTTVAAATAVSYAPQSLTGGEQLQARTNISAAGLSQVVRYDAAQNLTASEQAQARTNISAALRGQIFGLTLSNNVADPTNDIDISAGEAASAETNPVLMGLASTLTKRLDAAWAVGSGNGGLDTGTIANTTYHVWLIQRSDTGVVDALFSTSASSPTMPTNYDRKAYLWPILREGGAIVPFRQINQSMFERVTMATDRNSAAALASSLITLSVPTGVRVRPILLSTIVGNSTGAQNADNAVGSASKGSADIIFQRITSLSGLSQLNASVVDGYVQTNSSGQIYFSVAIGTGSLVSNTLQTKGWYIDRGYLT